MRGNKTPLREMRDGFGGAKARNRPLTIRKLAERTGYSIGHLSDVEQGRKRPSEALVANLARIYRRPLEQMKAICTASPTEAQP